MRPIALGLILLLTLASNPGFAETAPAVALIRAATGRLSLDGAPLENAAIGILTLDPPEKVCRPGDARHDSAVGTPAPRSSEIGPT